MRVAGGRPLLVLIGVSAATLLALLTLYVQFFRAGAISPRQTDFVAYYAASHLVWTGHAGDMYRFSTLGSVEARLVHPLVVRNGLLPFVYGPLWPAITAPLGALSLNAAYAVWLAINAGVLLASVAGLARVVPGGRTARVAFVLASLAFVPVFVAFVQGQVSIVLLAGLVLALRLYRSGRLASTGAVLAVLLLKPPLALPFLVLFLSRREWKAAIALTLTGLATIALPAALLGPGIDAGWFRVLRAAAGWHSQFGYGARWNHSLSGQIDLLLGPGSSATCIYIALGGVMIATMAWTARKPMEPARAFGLATVTALLVSPHVLLHDLTLLLVPACVLVAADRQQRAATPAALLLGMAAMYVGLRTVSSAPIQISVVVMLAMAVSLAARRAPRARTQPQLARRSGAAHHMEDRAW